MRMFRAIVILNLVLGWIGAQPVITSLSPSVVNAGQGGHLVTITGSGFTPGVSAFLNQASRSTTFVSPTQVDFILFSSDTTQVQTYAITVREPLPSLVQSNALSLTVQPVPTPVISSLSPNVVSRGSPAQTIVILGSGFGTFTQFRVGTTALAATLVSASEARITLAAFFFATLTVLNISATNPSPGGGTATATIQVVNPVPTISTLNPANQPYSAPQFGVVGSGFISGTTTVTVGGFPAAIVVNNSGILNGTLPAAIQGRMGSFPVVVTNPLPGGGSSAPAILTLTGPEVLSIQPASIAPLPISAANVLLTITGTGFQPACVVIADGIVLSTTFVSSTLVTASLSPVVPGRSRPGGIAIALQLGAATPSNAVPLNVGGFDNKGSIVTHPLQVSAGATFAVVLEGAASGTPFTLVADLAPTTPVAPFPNAASNQVLAVIGGQPVPVLDGLGLFGPVVPASFSPSPVAATPPGGRFVLPGIVKPNPAIGLAVALQYVIVDPTSPAGIRLSFPRNPLNF